MLHGATWFLYFRAPPDDDRSLLRNGLCMKCLCANRYVIWKNGIGDARWVTAAGGKMHCWRRKGVCNAGKIISAVVFSPQKGAAEFFASTPLDDSF
jgi:hypothetical protein